MKATLRTLSNDIKCFKLPVSALRDFEHCSPDLVIVDLMMPEMDGIEFTKQFRRNFELPNVPIILCSGHITHETSVEAANAGINDIVEKPFNPSKLIERINHLLPPLNSPHLNNASIANRLQPYVVDRPMPIV
jgi:DNA-binding response OmpR family regulator